MAMPLFARADKAIWIIVSTKNPKEKGKAAKAFLVNSGERSPTARNPPQLFEYNGCKTKMN